MDGRSAGEKMNLEQAASDPQLCIDFLGGGFDLSGLQQVLQNADHTWMEKFLRNGGLPSLLSTLDRKGDSSNNLQECVVCVKLVLNHKLGVKFILEQPGEDLLIQKLVQVFDTKCVTPKQDVLELLSALCLLSDKGYNLSLDALESYKQSKDEQSRFSVLIKEMQQSSSEEYLASILAFINCILKRANDLKKRIRLRNEFLALQLLDVLSPLRHTTNEALAIQIQVFNEAHTEDNDRMDKPGGVDLDSYEDMFHAVLNKVCCTGHNKSFLNILRNLLSLEEDDATLDMIWETMEKSCGQAVHSSTPTKMIASDPSDSNSQMEKESRVQSDGGPPPPPPPIEFGKPLPLLSEPKTKVAKARAHKPQRKMNRVSWSIIKKGQATDAGVIWQKAAEGVMDTKVDIDPARVEELFSKPEIPPVEDEPTVVERKGPKDKIFDLKLDTERDTTVTLKGLKMDNRSVVNSIVRIDPSVKMTTVHLKALEKQIAVVKPMLESYKGAQGDFPDDSSKSDQSNDGPKFSTVQDFYLQLTKVDRPDLRVKLMRAQVEYTEKLTDLQSPCSTLENAIKEILECETLTQLLLVVLTAGNIVNGGTFAGNAYGFTVDSLQWLNETKSSHSGMSFLHYIAEVCEDQSSDLLPPEILKELPSLKKASRIVYEDLEKEIDILEKSVNEFEMSFKGEDLSEDIKEKFDTVSGEVQKSLMHCKEILGRISQKKDKLAVYFCEDSRKLNLEKLLKRLLSFITEINKAREANSEKRRREMLRRRREAVAKEQKNKTVATQTSGSGRIEGDSSEPELDEGVIDDLLMEIKAGSLQCRWFL